MKVRSFLGSSEGPKLTNSTALVKFTYLFLVGKEVEVHITTLWTCKATEKEYKRLVALLLECLAPPQFLSYVRRYFDFGKFSNLDRCVAEHQTG